MNIKEKIKKFPDTSGVYIMKNAAGEIVYIGKATSLKERVRSYFSSYLPDKTKVQMSEVADIEYQETDSPLEALLLESRLIKKHLPKFNIKERDDKSRIYVHITREKFPRIHLLRETDLHEIKEKSPTMYGPFNSAHSIIEALELIRRVIPYRSCNVTPKKKCLYGYIGLCEAPCENLISEKEYKERIRKVRDFFEGKKNRVLNSLKKDLKTAAKKLEFEKAAKIRDHIFALEHMKQMFVIKNEQTIPFFRRIEGYDISNISGAYATGSMVVFVDGMSEKSEYRKFKIKNIKGANDTAMMKEIIQRRFKNDWVLPDLVLVDGGRGQVNAALSVLRSLSLNIPVIGLAKGPDRKKDELITSQTLPRAEISLFKEVRDEAHRFAKGYYEKLHRRVIKN
jgi:excinuclease ABC subunit C